MTGLLGSACTRQSDPDVVINCPLDRDWLVAVCAAHGERPALNQAGQGLTWTTTEVWLQGRFVDAEGRVGRRESRLSWGANRAVWDLPAGVKALRLQLLAAGGHRLRLPLAPVVLDPSAPRPVPVAIDLSEAASTP